MLGVLGILLIIIYPTKKNRIWVCQQFKLHDEELKKIDWYLIDDVGNNSAWNYRYHP